MCGIVGYVGPSVDGSGRWTSCWRACAGWSTAATTRPASRWSTATAVSPPRKRAGKLANLTEALDADPLPTRRTGIGHTRWATHGGPTDANAHPHLGGDDGKLALIHNGIIENFAALKAELLADGVEFRVRDRHRGRRAPARPRVRRRPAT